jgi:hypothetical protein
MEMSPEELAAAIGIVVFIGGSAGLVVQRMLPESFTTGGVRDMLGAVVGLLTLLSALVMGLLVWTAYGVYSGQNIAISTLAAKVLQLDIALADYGPDALSERREIRDYLHEAIEEIWSAGYNGQTFLANNLEAALRDLRKEQRPLAGLRPSTDEQKQALANANSALEAIGQARLQMSFALAAPVCYPVIIIVSCWTTALFFGYGLMSKNHPASIIAGIVGACAVASAFYLVLDLSRPYAGLFRASPEPLREALTVISNQ